MKAIVFGLAALVAASGLAQAGDKGERPSDIRENTDRYGLPLPTMHSTHPSFNVGVTQPANPPKLDTYQDHTLWGGR